MRKDAELVNAVLDGEKQAFAVLVKRYREITIPQRMSHRKLSSKLTNS